MNSEALLVGEPALTAANDYLGLTAAQRYEIISRHFPDWLLKEPIEFPPHHQTYGWSCLVDQCTAALAPTQTNLLCFQHTTAYKQVRDTTGLEEFVHTATPSTSQNFGWALTRKPSCAICGDNREAQGEGYCPAHFSSLLRARRRG